MSVFENSDSNITRKGFLPINTLWTFVITINIAKSLKEMIFWTQCMFGTVFNYLSLIFCHTGNI